MKITPDNWPKIKLTAENGFQGEITKIFFGKVPYCYVVYEATYKDGYNKFSFLVEENGIIIDNGENITKFLVLNGFNAAKIEEIK